MIDFTPIAVSVVGALITIVNAVFLAWLQSHLKDEAAKATISNAMTNALGAVKQAADAGLAAHPLQVSMPGISPTTAAGVQYVLNNAGPELRRFSDITPETIAEKVEARLGLQSLAQAAQPVIVVPGGSPPA
jgi:hypothetical protein